MTQPQPQCGHVKICYHVWSNVGHGCPYDSEDQNPEKKVCKHDTRTHSVAPEPDELMFQRRRVFDKLETGKCLPNGDCARCILCDNAGGCMAEETYQVQQAKREERELVKNLFEEFRVQNSWVDSDTDIHEPDFTCDDIREIFKKLESPRGV